MEWIRAMIPADLIDMSALHTVNMHKLQFSAELNYIQAETLPISYIPPPNRDMVLCVQALICNTIHPLPCDVNLQ